MSWTVLRIPEFNYSRSEDQNTKFIAEITVNGVLSRLKANKSPGLDVFSSEWYMTLQSELAPSLLQTFNSALKDEKIQPSWREAAISVIPEEKERLDCGSFRSISVTHQFLPRKLKGSFHILSTLTRQALSCRDKPIRFIRRFLHIVSHMWEHKLQALQPVWIHSEDLRFHELEVYIQVFWDTWVPQSIY